MSGLKFTYDSKETEMGWYEVTERLALTEDGRAVPEGDLDARWLYAIPGQRVPLEEAKRYGLVKSGKKAKVEVAAEPAAEETEAAADPEGEAAVDADDEPDADEEPVAEPKPKAKPRKRRAAKG